MKGKGDDLSSELDQTHSELEYTFIIVFPLEAFSNNLSHSSNLIVTRDLQIRFEMDEELFVSLRNSPLGYVSAGFEENRGASRERRFRSRIPVMYNRGE